MRNVCAGWQRRLDRSGYVYDIGSARLLASPTLWSVLIEIDEDNWEQVLDRLQSADLAIRDRVQRTAKGPAYALFTRDRPADDPGILTV